MIYLFYSSASSEGGELGELERKDHLLRMSMADKKGSDKYVKQMEGQLRETWEKNRELDARFEAQKDKLAESSKHNVKLTSKVVEYQESMTCLSEENSKIKEENAELAAQVTQLGDILRERRENRSTGADFKLSGNTPSLNEDISITDISMDDPPGTYN